MIDTFLPFSFYPILSLHQILLSKPDNCRD